MARTEVASDTFTDGSAPRSLASYQALWVNTFPSATLVQTDVTGTLWSEFGSDCSYYYNTTFSDDQYSEITLSTMAQYNGVILRSSTDTNANRDYYVAYLELISGSNYYVHIAKVLNGSGRTTHLASSASTSWANGDRLSAEIVGNTINVYRNYTGSGDVSIANYTDLTTPLTTGYPGFFMATNTSTKVLTAWSGGNVTAGSSTVTGRSLLLGIG